MSSRRNRIMLLIAVADTLVTLGAGTALARSPAYASAPASAETITRHQVVDMADLDLRSPAGRAQLDRRISLAVQQVCQDAAPESNAAIRCRSDALRDARHQVAAVTAQQRAAELASRN